MADRVFTSVLLVALAFVLIIMGTLIGAISGWVVGLFFSNSILPVFTAMGIYDISMWQLGATLGFVSGFFKSTTQVSSQ